MSLTLPSNYESASKNSNIKENWLYQLFNNDSYLSFDGSNDYIDLGTTTANSAINVKGVSASGSGISVSFFINFPETGSREPIFASNSTATYSGYWIEKDANDKINFNWGDDSGAGSQDRRTMTSNTVLSANTWYHVLITSTFANPTSGTDIYINNSASALSASGTATVTTPTYVSDGKAYIAREDFTATNYGGKLYIKNLAIWSGVLDSNNRTAIYNSGNYKSLLYNFGNYNQVSNLKGYWELNNGEPVINDLSGNGLHGTINGATYGGYLPLSTTDTLVDDVFYHGVVTKTGSIRDSIDLQNSKAKTSNVSFSIANFKYKGSDISSKLFLGDIEYINYNVKIYSQLNNNSSLSNCLQIYQGRLINVSHNDSSVSIQLTEKRPWDFLSIPTEKTTQKNIYIPISYGNYTKNSATTFESPLFESELSSKAYRPVPLNKTFSDKILYVDGNNTSSDGQLAVYEKSVDTFVPLENAIASTVNTDNAEHSQSDLSQLRSFKQRAESVEVSSNDGVTITNAEKAFDGDSNTYANYSIDIDGQEGAVRIRLDYDFHSVSGKSSDDFKILRSATNLRVLTAEGLTDTETDLNIDDATNVSVHDVIKVDDEQIIVNSISSNELDDITRGFNSKKESHDDNVLIRLNNTVTVLGLTYQIDVNRSGDDVGNNTVRTRGDISVGFTSNDVSKRTIYTHFSNNTTSATFEIEFDLNEIEPLLPSFDAEFRIYDIFLHTQRVSEAPEEMLYVANDGLTESYSGSADLVEHGHEALRDILTRFVGLDTSTPDGWSDLHTDRHIDNWKIRYWTLEPKDIQTILDKITYEFGFIFKYRADATSRVIYIKQSSELSASQTLTNRDIKNIQVSMSGFNNVISKMIINYQKHPAIKEYIANITSSNDEVRTKYKIQSQENTKEIKLDMNVGTPASTPQSDPNADFYSYYNNIIGDVKKIVKCDIINSSKSYNLETGDIVKFDDMPVNPFGHNWNESGSQYYMITSLNRSIGSVSIECREVG